MLYKTKSFCLLTTTPTALLVTFSFMVDKFVHLSPSVVILTTLLFILNTFICWDACFACENWRSSRQQKCTCWNNPKRYHGICVTIQLQSIFVLYDCSPFQWDHANLFFFQFYSTLLGLVQLYILKWHVSIKFKAKYQLYVYTCTGNVISFCWGLQIKVFEFVYLLHYYCKDGLSEFASVIIVFILRINHLCFYMFYILHWTPCCEKWKHLFQNLHNSGMAWSYMFR